MEVSMFSSTLGSDFVSPYLEASSLVLLAPQTFPLMPQVVLRSTVLHLALSDIVEQMPTVSALKLRDVATLASPKCSIFLGLWAFCSYLIGQSNPERAALTDFAYCSDRTVVGLHDRLADGQS